MLVGNNPKFVFDDSKRYEIKWRYGKWRVIDTHTNTVLTKVNTKELAETYLRLLGEGNE